MKKPTGKKKTGKQVGGTLLGLVVGVLVGLGAALAVAVYVTKVPIPFLNRSTSHGAENDAAEAQKNKNWDPNAGLAGKPVGKPLPPTASGTLTTPQAPAVVTVPPSDNKVPSADPLGDLANARANAKPAAKPDAPAASSGPDPFNYFIQVGAFRTPEDAEQQRAKLSLLGFQARVTEREQSGRTVYRVRLGPFDKKDEADKTKERLDNNSIETALVRVQR